MKKFVLATLAAVTIMAPQTVFAADGPELISTAVLPEIALKAASNSAIANSVENDQGILVGGVSDLYHVPGDAADIFYVVTDRGPNNDTVQPDKSSGTGFVVPTFSPIIMKVQLSGATVKILETIAITTGNGAGVTGLPNVKGYDTVPTDVRGITANSLYSLAGLDAEGLVKTATGDFWTVDEYAPSLVQLSSKGVVTKRYVPKGWKGDPTTFKAVKTIPEIYLKRKANRGFEALALSPDGRTLFVGLQSPLLNPTRAVGDASLATRILRFDIRAKVFTGEFVFGFEKVSAVDAKATKNSDLKLSAMVALDSNTLLVQERTDNSFLLSTFTIDETANILGSKWDFAATTPSLESYTGVGTNAEVEKLIAASTKKIVFNSTSIPTMPGKIEGFAVLDAQRIVVVNDNDFSFVYNVTSGLVEIGKLKTSFLTIKLPIALPTYPEAAAARYGKFCSIKGLVAGNLTCKILQDQLRWRK
ncbi:MAG: esterase-like activity of phytase family protein [Actinobacteria bacterium]|nr:esterase-like activity of phytase family protein [Actinomycetota bacterium]